jgi:hypothetical protein
MAKPRQPTEPDVIVSAEPLWESNPGLTHYEKPWIPLPARYLHRRAHLRPGKRRMHGALRVPGHDPGHGSAPLPVTESHCLSAQAGE